MARLLPLAEFTYDNAKNASTDHILFELYYNSYSKVFFEEDMDSH